MQDFASDNIFQPILADTDLCNLSIYLFVCWEHQIPPVVGLIFYSCLCGVGPVADLTYSNGKMSQQSAD